MAKSKRKKIDPKAAKAAEKKFLLVTLLVTLVLIAIIYMVYSSSM